MKNRKHRYRWYIILALIGLLRLYLWPTVATARPLTAKQRLEHAWQQLGFSVGLSLPVLGLVGLAVVYHREPLFYGAAVGVMLVSMLVTPLLQANQIQAFSARQRARQAEAQRQREAEAALTTTRDEVSGRSYNPLAGNVAASMQKGA